MGGDQSFDEDDDDEDEEEEEDVKSSKKRPALMMAKSSVSIYFTVGLKMYWYSSVSKLNKPSVLLNRKKWKWTMTMMTTMMSGCMTLFTYALLIVTPEDDFKYFKYIFLFLYWREDDDVSEEESPVKVKANKSAQKASIG